MSLFFNQDTVVYLYMTCIVIEMYHIIFHNFVYSMENGIIKSFSAINEFEKGLNHIVNVSNIYESCLYLKEILGLVPPFDDKLSIKKYIHNCKLKLVSMYSGKYILQFIFQQFIEVIYWALSLIIAIKDFPRGTVVFAMLLILSYMHKRGNDSFKYYYLFDSIFCIVMYITCISFFI